MTAPIWLASPPEVHSALLSAGPGPGPLLAAAAAWRALGVEYLAVADELTALLSTVQAGAWDGPSAASYAAANLPYLAWLGQAGAVSAATAARQETAAAAYTAALAAMPTLAELAANHAVHAVLLATNFFGINTIPIALNEADYARMWVQAAAVMSGYQAVAGAAAAAAPATPAAPKIVKAHAAADDSTWPPLPPDTENDIMAWMTSHGYLKFYNDVIQPMVNALANNPFLQSIFNGFDPYLSFTGNPLSFLSPFNVAFALGYPMTFSQYAAFLSETFGFIGADLTAAFASGNPASIAATLLFTAVEAIGTIITDTIALLKTLLEQAVVLIPVMLPLITAALAPLAAAPAGLSGLAGLAGLTAVPAVPVPPVVPPPVALALTAPPAPVPAPAPPPVAAPTPAPPPPAAGPPAAPPAPPPAITGPELMVGYLVAGVRQDARRRAAAAAKRKTPTPTGVAEPAPAQPVEEPARTRRRRRVKASMLGRGYEYMDLEDDPAPPVTVRDCGPLGATGATRRTGAPAPAGLTALTEDAFEGATTPMVPGSWDGVR